MDNTPLFNSINKKVSLLLNNELLIILQKISDQYNININELKQIVNNENNSDKCLARKQDGLQCTRNKKPNKDFCGKHLHSRKFGRVDDNQYMDNTLDNECIKTHVENINANDYLVDDDNYVYTNNIENPELIGRKENNSILEIKI